MCIKTVDVSPVTGEELEPVALAPVREETPSQPTGVRIDGNKLMAVHNEVVRVTEGFTVEKLERTYAILAKVEFKIFVDFRSLIKNPQFVFFSRKSKNYHNYNLIIIFQTLKFSMQSFSSRDLRLS